MRMTFNALQTSLAAINDAATQFATAQEQVASGKRIHLPSDDPTSMQRAIQDVSEIATLDSYSRASDTAAARLSVIDAVLGAVVDRITDATATTAGASGNTADQVSRDAASEKLAGIRDALVGDFNTEFRGSSVFAGSKAQSTAYAKLSGVWTYQGDHAPVSADIGRNRSVTLATDGQAIVQGSDPADIFTELDALVIAVRTGNATAIGAGMKALTGVFNRVVQAQSRVGNDEESLADGQEQLVALRLAGLARLSNDRDANLAEAIVKMNQAQIAYQSALGAVGKANQSSLLDFI